MRFFPKVKKKRIMPNSIVNKTFPKAPKKKMLGEHRGRKSKRSTIDKLLNG